MLEQKGRPQFDSLEGFGEVPPPDVPVQMIVRSPRLLDEDFSDPHKLEKHPHLDRVIRGLQDRRYEVFAYSHAHKGAVLTVISVAAFASGIVGVGIYIKRRENKEPENK